MTPRRHHLLREVSRSAYRRPASCRVFGAAPRDRSAALGRDYRVDGVLEHQHVIAGGERDGPARTALADPLCGNDRHADVEAGLDRARRSPRSGRALRRRCRDRRRRCRQKSAAVKLEMLSRSRINRRAHLRYPSGRAMPKLCLTRAPRCQRPFPVPMTTTLLPRNRAEPANDRLVLGEGAVAEPAAPDRRRGRRENRRNAVARGGAPPALSATASTSCRSGAADGRPAPAGRPDLFGDVEAASPASRGGANSSILPSSSAIGRSKSRK